MGLTAHSAKAESDKRKADPPSLGATARQESGKGEDWDGTARIHLREGGAGWRARSDAPYLKWGG